MDGECVGCLVNCWILFTTMSICICIYLYLLIIIIWWLIDVVAILFVDCYSFNDYCAYYILPFCFVVTVCVACCFSVS